ncbi:ankyrin repeat-containing domain protein, partial [Immersiella caudata]
SALESAVSYGRVNVARMLLSYGASPDAESDNGMTPGIQAAVAVLGNVAATKKLLALGADVNAPTRGKKTPLMATVSTDRLSPCFEVLLRAGADLYARDLINKTVLHMACAKGHATAVRALLRLGMDPNDGGTSGTGLGYAPIRDAVDVMRALVEKGADVNQRTTEGYTPLVSATSRNAHRCIQFLLESGAN